MKKRFAITVLALALTAGSAMTSFAAGFTGTGKGVKYQWGDGAYCTNNWVQYKNHWFYFGDDQLTHEFTENGTTDGGPYVYNEWNSNGTIKRGTKFGVR